MYKVGILGATGYTGIELIRILSNHEQVNLVYLGSSSQAGKKLSDVYPQYLGKVDLMLESPEDAFSKDLDVMFLALPHGVAMGFVKKLWEKSSMKIIDLSADFRFKDQKLYEKWYKKHIVADLMKEAVYALPELVDREVIKQARLIANPGCYVLASLTACKPLVDELAVESVIIDAKSGVSGAGRSLNQGSHFVEANESCTPYKLDGHRHQPEIESFLGMDVIFSPHLVPMNRGIVATCYLKLKDDIKLADAYEIYKKYYGDSEFVKISKSGVSTKDVRGTNYVHLTLVYHQERKTLVAISVIDNLVKGASGNAVQNMNIVLGLSETTGLEALPRYI